MGCVTSSSTRGEDSTVRGSVEIASPRGGRGGGWSGGGEGDVPQPPSKPLSRLTTRYQHGRSITARQLQQQRNEFWATRVDGNSQSWLALKNVSEAFLGGDIELANALLEASMITTPNGSLDLCYDERGHQYKVPMYCFADPVELLADGGSSSSSGGSSSSSSSSSNSNLFSCFLFFLFVSGLWLTVDRCQATLDDSRGSFSFE